MTDRRSLAHRRSPTRDMVATSVAMHRQSPAGPRHIGWIVQTDAERTLFVTIAEDETWRWTGAKRDATQFISRGGADSWIRHNLNGAARAIEVRA